MIKEISEFNFDTFANESLYSSFYQSSSYANCIEEDKKNIIYVGYYEEGKLVACTLIFVRIISNMIKYGYAPKGFIIDYEDTELLKRFTTKLKSFLLRKNLAFLRINPEIILAKIDYINEKRYVSTRIKGLLSFLESIGYKRNDNEIKPYYPITDLDTFINDSLLNEINEDNETFLHLLLATENELGELYKYLDNYLMKDYNFYLNLYKNFKNKNMADLILIELNFNKYLEKYKRLYEKVNAENEELNNLFSNNPTNEQLYELKMKSDKKLSKIKHTLDIFNNNMITGVEKEYIGGALAIKHKGKVTIFTDGINRDLSVREARYFLYYNLIMYYKEKGYKYLAFKNLNNDFLDDNPYNKKERFALKFNPSVYEHVGSLDLVVNSAYYNMLKRNGKLEEEFNN